MKRCSICNGLYDGFGNNAEPVNSGRCCRTCNFETVLPVRIMQLENPRLAKVLIAGFKAQEKGATK